MKHGKQTIRLLLSSVLMTCLLVLSGCQSESQLPPQPSTQSLTQQLLDTKRIVVQGIPASLDKPEKVDYSNRLLGQFNASETPAVATGVASTTPVITTTYDNVDYEEYFLPDQYSIFLIHYGSDADDLATRYNTLLQYTHGLLNAIQQSNEVSVLPPKK